jgi:anti-sigma B factor antagonist
MELTTSDQGPVTVVSIKGTLGVGAADEKFRHKLKELLDSGHIRLVLDCTELHTMDSTGLNAFIMALTDAQKKKGALTLLAPNERVLSVFQTTQLDEVFGVHQSLDEAVASVRPPA